MDAEAPDGIKNYAKKNLFGRQLKKIIYDEHTVEL